MQWIWIASGHTAISSHVGFVPPKPVSTGKRVGRRCVPVLYLAFPSMDAWIFFSLNPLMYCVCIQYCIYVHSYICMASVQTSVQRISAGRASQPNYHG